MKKKKVPGGSWYYTLYIKTKKGQGGKQRVGRIVVDASGMVNDAGLKGKFRGMGLGKAFYSRVLQHQHKVSPGEKFPFFGDQVQSGPAHQVWSGLGRGPKTSGPKKVKGAKQDVREVRTVQLPLKPGEKVRPGRTEGTLPIVLHRPGSKRAKEQAQRFTARGRPRREWTTTEQIKRWKRAKHSGADPVELREMGLAPPRFVGKSPTRKAPHIEVKARDKKTRSFAKAQRRGDMSRDLGARYGSNWLDARKIQRLQKALPKDSPFLFGTVFRGKRTKVKTLTREEVERYREVSEREGGGVKYLNRSDKKFMDAHRKAGERVARAQGKRLHGVKVAPEGSKSRDLTANVWEPAYQARILNKKMREADHTQPSRKYGRAQKPHGKRKAERPARDHTKGFDLKDRSTW
jgi:hypothetical protein